MVIKTSYGTGPYVVDRVSGPCNKCCHPHDTFDEGPKLPEHFHLHLLDMEEEKRYWVNFVGYDLINVREDSDDKVIILKEAHGQMKFF